MPVMSKPVTLPLQRLARAPRLLSLPPTRSLSTLQSPIYQCLSPLSRRPTHPQSPSRSPIAQWHAARTVYTTKGSTFMERARELQRTNPITFPLSLFCIFLGFLGAVYTAWYYINVIAPIDRMFPAPIATKLKRALYYTHQDIQPNKAWDYYRQALALCEEHELHPFSAEVMGIKLQSVAMLENTNHLREAVEILEVLKKDCLKFVEYCGRPDKGALRKHRTRVLEKCVQMSVKLGEMYSGVYTRDDEKAEANLVEALEMLLREAARRREKGITEEDEGPWLDNEQIGASLESLADVYEQQSKHYLAAPLYLRAVTMAQPPSCHTAVLMNNLAASLAQTSPERPPASSDTRNDPPTSRSVLISNARQWTEKSLEICQSLKPPTRTEECDAACAVATHNLGEFAEMEGLVAEARKRYEEARGLSKALGFTEGVENAAAGLKRLAGQA